MITYSIKDLERISGIKAHTLRIWEQRYNILKPSRTESNIRLYTNEDLKFIMNISLLNNHGFKISKLAKLSAEEINNEVIRLYENSESEEEQMKGLFMAMTQFDEQQFVNLVDKNIKARGLIHTIEHILFPLLKKTGIMWQAGAVFPAQEHFISNIIRDKILIATHNLECQNTTKTKKFILFLPEEELHELSLLFCNYLIRYNGHSTYYLGQAVPLDDIKKTYEILQPEFLVTIITQPLKSYTIESYLVKIKELCPETALFISGFQLFNSFYNIPDGITVFNNAEDLNFYLSKLNS